ncbi:MAG: hypothetical protein D6798_01275 [Deltaproteobacteria bacterium]|nr:MAG: hypothetical protein D6798_01275 [Deltaproteobacteria bacterium]
MAPASSVEALAARGLVAHGLVVHHVDAAHLEVSLPGDSEDRRATLSLGSLRRVLALADPAQHEQRVEAWAATAAAVLRGEAFPGPVEERLVPRLLGAPDPRLWTTPVADGLHLAIAEDLPGRQRLLTPFDLPRMGLSVHRLPGLALDNLARLTPPPVLLSSPRGARAWQVGDGLDAARLLLLGRPAAMDGMPRPDTGALAVVPARDLCWWVPVDGESTVQAGVDLWGAAQGLGSLPYPLSPRLWWVRSGGVEAVELRREHGTVRLVLPPGLAAALCR